jgi:hypothetical protein
MFSGPPSRLPWSCSLSWPLLSVCFVALVSFFALWFPLLLLLVRALVLLLVLALVSPLLLALELALMLMPLLLLMLALVLVLVLMLVLVLVLLHLFLLVRTLVLLLVLALVLALMLVLALVPVLALLVGVGCHSRLGDSPRCLHRDHAPHHQGRSWGEPSRGMGFVVPLGPALGVGDGDGDRWRSKCPDNSFFVTDATHMFAVDPSG